MQPALVTNTIRKHGVTSKRRNKQRPYSNKGAKTLIAAFSSWVEASSIDSSGDYENHPLPPSRGDWIQQLHVASPPVALVCSLMRSSSLAVFRPPLNWLASSYKKLQASRFHPSSGPETHWPSNHQVEIKFLQSLTLFLDGYPICFIDLMF